MLKNPIDNINSGQKWRRDDQRGRAFPFRGLHHIFMSIITFPFSPSRHWSARNSNGNRLRNNVRRNRITEMFFRAQIEKKDESTNASQVCGVPKNLQRFFFSFSEQKLLRRISKRVFEKKKLKDNVTELLPDGKSVLAEDSRILSMILKDSWRSLRSQDEVRVEHLHEVNEEFLRILEKPAFIGKPTRLAGEVLVEFEGFSRILEDCLRFSVNNGGYPRQRFQKRPENDLEHR